MNMKSRFECVMQSYKCQEYRRDCDNEFVIVGGSSSSNVCELSMSRELMGANCVM